MRIPEKTRRQKNVSAEMQEERNFTGTDYDVYVMEKKEMGKSSAPLCPGSGTVRLSLFSQLYRSRSGVCLFCFSFARI